MQEAYVIIRVLIGIVVLFTSSFSMEESHQGNHNKVFLWFDNKERLYTGSKDQSDKLFQATLSDNKVVFALGSHISFLEETLDFSLNKPTTIKDTAKWKKFFDLNSIMYDINDVLKGFYYPDWHKEALAKKIKKWPVSVEFQSSEIGAATRLMYIEAALYYLPLFLKEIDDNIQGDWSKPGSLVSQQKNGRTFVASQKNALIEGPMKSMLEHVSSLARMLSGDEGVPLSEDALLFDRLWEDTPHQYFSPSVFFNRFEYKVNKLGKKYTLDNISDEQKRELSQLLFNCLSMQNLKLEYRSFLLRWERDRSNRAGKSFSDNEEEGDILINAAKKQKALFLFMQTADLQQMKELIPSLMECGDTVFLENPLMVFFMSLCTQSEHKAKERLALEEKIKNLQHTLEENRKLSEESLFASLENKEEGPSKKKSGKKKTSGHGQSSTKENSHQDAMHDRLKDIIESQKQKIKELDGDILQLKDALKKKEEQNTEMLNQNIKLSADLGRSQEDFQISKEAQAKIKLEKKGFRKKLEDAQEEIKNLRLKVLQLTDPLELIRAEMQQMQQTFCGMYENLKEQDQCKKDQLESVGLRFRDYERDISLKRDIMRDLFEQIEDLREENIRLVELLKMHNIDPYPREDLIQENEKQGPKNVYIIPARRMEGDLEKKK